MYIQYDIIFSLSPFQLLVEEGANVNAIDLFGDTPLHNALRHHTMTQLKELKQTPDVSKVNDHSICYTTEASLCE